MSSPVQTKGRLESFSPVDGRPLGAVETITPGQVQAVVDDVAEVQPFWAALPVAERGRYMRRAAQVVIDSLDELSELLTREQGKPRNESYVMELLPTIDSLHWIADNGPKILGDERISLPIFLKQKRAKFAYEPLGVVGVIAPWNYPWSIPFGEVAIALMAGNGVVLKPASLTPLIGQQIQRVFDARRPARGAGAHRARREARWGRRWWSRARQDLLHRIGRGRPGRGRRVRRADEGLGARAGRQGPDAGAVGRQPAERRGRAPSGAASPTPARPARASSAST